MYSSPARRTNAAASAALPSSLHSSAAASRCFAACHGLVCPDRERESVGCASAWV